MLDEQPPISINATIHFANLSHYNNNNSNNISNNVSSSSHYLHSNTSTSSSGISLPASSVSGSSSSTSSTLSELNVNIGLTSVYLIIFLIGVVGNVCNCLVIADHKNRYMKTATNYYLFSLSVSDLLLLIFGLPHDLVNLWHPSPYMFNRFVCISRGWISEASTNASVLVIVAFTVERYLAICHPLKAHTLSRLSRSVKIIILIWLVASSCALIVVMQYDVILITERIGPIGANGQQQEVSTYQCTLTSRNETIFELSVVIFFIIPMTVITILYVNLGYHLRLKRAQLMKQQKEGKKWARGGGVGASSSISKSAQQHNEGNLNVQLLMKTNGDIVQSARANFECRRIQLNKNNNNKNKKKKNYRHKEHQYAISQSVTEYDCSSNLLLELQTATSAPTMSLQHQHQHTTSTGLACMTTMDSGCLTQQTNCDSDHQQQTFSKYTTKASKCWLGTNSIKQVKADSRQEEEEQQQQQQQQEKEGLRQTTRKQVDSTTTTTTTGSNGKGEIHLKLRGESGSCWLNQTAAAAAKAAILLLSPAWKRRTTRRTTTTSNPITTASNDAHKQQLKNQETNQMAPSACNHVGSSDDGDDDDDQHRRLYRGGDPISGEHEIKSAGGSSIDLKPRRVADSDQQQRSIMIDVVATAADPSTSTSTSPNGYCTRGLVFDIETKGEQEAQLSHSSGGGDNEISSRRSGSSSSSSSRLSQQANTTTTHTTNAASVPLRQTSAPTPPARHFKTEEAPLLVLKVNGSRCKLNGAQLEAQTTFESANSNNNDEQKAEDCGLVCQMEEQSKQVVSKLVEQIIRSSSQELDGGGSRSSNKEELGGEGEEDRRSKKDKYVPEQYLSEGYEISDKQPPTSQTESATEGLVFTTREVVSNYAPTNHQKNTTTSSATSSLSLKTEASTIQMAAGKQFVAGADRSRGRRSRRRNTHSSSSCDSIQVGVTHEEHCSFNNDNNHKNNIHDFERNIKERVKSENCLMPTPAATTSTSQDEVVVAVASAPPSEAAADMNSADCKKQCIVVMVHEDDDASSACDEHCCAEDTMTTAPAADDYDNENNNRLLYKELTQANPTTSTATTTTTTIASTSTSTMPQTNKHLPVCSKFIPHNTKAEFNSNPCLPGEEKPIILGRSTKHNSNTNNNNSKFFLESQAPTKPTNVSGASSWASLKLNRGSSLRSSSISDANDKSMIEQQQHQGFAATAAQSQQSRLDHAQVPAYVIDKSTSSDQAASAVVATSQSPTALLKIQQQQQHHHRYGTNNRKPIALNSTANAANLQAVIKMLVSVVVMFFICWAPFHAQRLMAIYVTEPTPQQTFIYNLLNHISGISYYISAIVNPILYSLFSVKFRQAFRDTFGSFRVCSSLMTLNSNKM